MTDGQPYKEINNEADLFKSTKSLKSERSKKNNLKKSNRLANYYEPVLVQDYFNKHNDDYALRRQIDNGNNSSDDGNGIQDVNDILYPHRKYWKSATRKINAVNAFSNVLSAKRQYNKDWHVNDWGRGEDWWTEQNTADNIGGNEDPNYKEDREQPEIDRIKKYLGGRNPLPPKVHTPGQKSTPKGGAPQQKKPELADNYVAHRSVTKTRLLWTWGVYWLVELGIHCSYLAGVFESHVDIDRNLDVESTQKRAKYFAIIEIILNLIICILDLGFLCYKEDHLITMIRILAVVLWCFVMLTASLLFSIIWGTADSDDDSDKTVQLTFTQWDIFNIIGYLEIFGAVTNLIYSHACLTGLIIQFQYIPMIAITNTDQHQKFNLRDMRLTRTRRGVIYIEPWYLFDEDGEMIRQSSSDDEIYHKPPTPRKDKESSDFYTKSYDGRGFEDMDPLERSRNNDDSSSISSYSYDSGSSGGKNLNSSALLKESFHTPVKKNSATDDKNCLTADAPRRTRKTQMTVQTAKRISGDGKKDKKTDPNSSKNKALLMSQAW